MERKNNAYLIVVIVIALIALFSGCVEEKNIASMETPTDNTSPTSTSENETIIPTPTPKVTVELPTLEPGYEWYQNDKFRYTIAYPKDWGTSSSNTSFHMYPQEFTSVFGSEDSLASYVHIDVITSSNHTQSRFWEYGVFADAEIPIGLEKLKEQGRIIEYKNISVNDNDGIELVFSPLILYFGPELAPSGIPTTARYILFTNDELDYIIQISSSDIFYDEYEDTFEYIINSFIIY